MIKQKFTLTLGLISILLGSLAASSEPALAGQEPPPGTDISALIAETQRVRSLLETLTSIISPITGVSFTPGDGGNVDITIFAPQIQINLNTTANQIITVLREGLTTGDPVNAIGSLVDLLLRGTNPAIADAIISSLTANGVPPELAEPLIDNLGVVNDNRQSNIPGTEQLVATTKNLKGDSAIAQAAETPNINININNLNKAIETYNRIIKQSDLPTLQKLSKDETFMAINKVLKELRAALNTSN